ncbi:alpha/beta hydrolase [Sphaerisporangium krabiense]|uniref:Pimeloyl-ACP methyl ester carboxylesterase n=1 Tax=Sphaerisporangium krabiense TaxID=763782 RepID=A0A7W9DTG8_9ACTN|nr:alpha/beta hydrolase [Sphaerisporangium krabiense]MBB5630787.1 pimeloyl-ACP methyl ester carboxylesterase [Sphaerisporangium krabiense]GII65531.1 alpha/beta hydrolase [Sphaerisporangium krabiense]
MATYVLVHGAASDSWYWHLVAPELRARGHDVVAPDLPCGDDAAGFPEYADTVVAAIGDRVASGADLILVAQSLAGFTAPLVCERVPVRLLVMLAAMVPAPGESAGDWWGNTGQPQAARELAEREGRSVESGEAVTFLHDVPPAVAGELLSRPSPGQSGTPFAAPWPLDAWPRVPTRFLLCRDDRLFPAPFMRRVVRERLGIVPDEMDGGHLPALARPKELTERLEAYREDVGPR